MLQDTAQMKQATGSSDAHRETRPNNDAGVVHTGDKTTVEGPTAVEREEEMVAEASRGKPRTATTVSSESKQTGQSSNVHTSSNAFEQETDPTSSPSEILDKPDRKCTESPIDSDEAVYGSDSVHSESSESSTDANDSKKRINAAVNADKVEAIGRQFEDLGIGNEAVSFHNPADEDEARHINDMVIRAHKTMRDIDDHPEERFRDPGSEFRVSARPKESPEPAPDTQGDETHKRYAHFPPDHLQHCDIEIEEGYSVEGPRRPRSSCCIIV
ncbi:hypothetical protein IMSHALPRED_003785 [Imshaugia aleurites]|uniref:Uncharacterized protein n=1 Tax=Imshaugia aleurites TaxID=172621 RepID=A0A8H3F5D1_9LECA|nr:hypothetical protein IMSHALPRED_003785 [Imshaugia aleurites]